MNFATINDTIDWFEALLVLGCVVGLLVAGVCVRSGWREFRYGQRDGRLYMRDLGVVQIAIAILLFSAVAVVFQCTLFQLMVPSAINTQEAVIDTMAATDTRLSLLYVIFSLASICMILTWWRRETIQTRREMAVVARSQRAAAQTAQVVETGEAVEAVKDAGPVIVEAPAIVVPEASPVAGKD